LQFDHRLLNRRVDPAEHAREQIAAQQQRLGGDRGAVVVALVQRHDGIGYGGEQLVTGERSACGRHCGLLSPPSRQGRARGEGRGPDERCSLTP